MSRAVADIGWALAACLGMVVLAPIWIPMRLRRTRRPQAVMQRAKPHLAKVMGAIIVNVVAVLLVWLGIPILLWLLG